MNDERLTAVAAREAVLRAFDEPHLRPETLFETAAALEPTIRPEVIRAAVISLLNRQELEMGWDGRIRRVNAPITVTADTLALALHDNEWSCPADCGDDEDAARKLHEKDALAILAAVTRSGEVVEAPR